MLSEVGNSSGNIDMAGSSIAKQEHKYRGRLSMYFKRGSPKYELCCHEP
jgi:hypothetical protein